MGIAVLQIVQNEDGSHPTDEEVEKLEKPEKGIVLGYGAICHSDVKKLVWLKHLALLKR